jgi:hypothetical protein
MRDTDFLQCAFLPDQQARANHHLPHSVHF